MEEFLRANNYNNYEILNSITDDANDITHTLFKYEIIIDNLDKLPILLDSIIDSHGNNIFENIKINQNIDELIDDKTYEYIYAFKPSHSVIKSHYIRELHLYETSGPYTVIAYNFIIKSMYSQFYMIQYQN